MEKVTLSNADIADGKGRKLQEDFEARFIIARAPNDAVLYENLNTATEGHHFFFSPTAVAIAGPILDSYRAVNCTEPLPGTFAVLVSSKTGRGAG